MSKTRNLLPFEMAKDERGTVLPMFALMSTIAIAAVGGAVDFGRAYQQRVKIQTALDTSITSGLRQYQLNGNWTEAQTLAQNLFAAQFSNFLVKDANGTIYDPRNGKTYKSIVSKNADGTLAVKGCIAFFCQTQKWTPAR